MLNSPGFTQRRAVDFRRVASALCS
ncbi:putative leader peptide [Streptomyces bathyalis]